ncbi:glycoside hydrolase family 66 protein [Neobacillus cucumis]|uniref:glycoside hydrolase family 66 protein n=1 Tax=Neobacillus cucumis TaxID=1740721 RepID=UPI002853649E|nr:glycoside hydrolase family 66 protein [Neobacillus cucumis]MDR4945189.1 glycoside hydrolase family 66 protein [Neobacillus cucumis]
MLIKKKLLLISLVSIILFFIASVFTIKSLFFQKQQIPKKENQIIKSITTDKASYHPNEPVHFITNLRDRYKDGTLNITYYHLNDIIFQQKIKITKNQAQWTWEPPKKDFKGYLVRVQYESEKEQDHQTIAVDVSSDWSKFPRYGFLSSFPDMSNKQMKTVISQLNRYHVNGLQFYDWHYKHHLPIKLENNEPASHWEDIANRPVSLKTLKTYIDLAHERNMKTMAYNLLYGALAEAEKDGVNKEWRLFKDQQRNAYDFHPLPADWKSNIYLVNPANREWQNYLINQQKKVYKALPFDGWHIDQLGPRENVYDYNGNPVALDKSFQAFIAKAKKEMPKKRLVMNAVSQYGQTQISQSPVDFLYTEVWDQDKYFIDLKRIIDENKKYSRGKYNTVLAAYMDSEYSNQKGQFNEPGILLTNSVIFASGGAHLELGEHMLSKEYFPNENLKMSSSLQTSLTHYYDFLVAYENLLRDRVQEEPVSVDSYDGVQYSSQPEQGKIWTMAKQNATKKIIHFINFCDATTLEWRDTNANQVEPKNQKDLTVKLAEHRQIKKIWIASPDKQNSLPFPLTFKQENNEVTFTLPSLKYWDMVVIEYRN